LYALRICDIAAKLGWNSFLAEKDILPGEDWACGIRKALKNSNLFIAVLTPDWVSSEWTIGELSRYSALIKDGLAENKILFLEFQKVKIYDHFIPMIENRQRVVEAATLSNDEISWLMHCAYFSVLPGIKETWSERGSEITSTIQNSQAVNIKPASNFQKEAVKLTVSERLRLEDELCNKIKSMVIISEIAKEMGYNAEELPKVPRSAWYYLIDRANRGNTIAQLMDLVDRYK
jgi:hypothetical protein